MESVPVKYRAYGSVVGSKYLGEFDATSPEEAHAKALADADVSLCHQCAGECEDPSIERVVVEWEEDNAEPVVTADAIKTYDPDDPDAPKPVTLDDYHWHEAIDRTHVVLCNFDEYVAEHPAIKQTPELLALADEISEKLGAFHQAIASKRPENDE
jgi:hypothetical protein